MNAIIGFLNDSKKCYNILFILLWIQSTLLSFFSNILNSIFKELYIGNIIITLVFSLFFILSFPYIYKKIRYTDVFMVCIFFLIYLATYTFSEYSSVRNFLFNNAIQILLINWCIYFIGLSYTDQNLLKILHKFSILAILANIIGILIFGISNLDSADNMGRAYRLLPHCLLFIHFLFKNKKVIDFLLTISTIVLILGFSSRGPLFLMLIFLLLYFLILKKVTLSFSLFSFSIICIFYYCFDSILSFASGILSKFGMNQRIIDYLYASNFLEFNSRDSIAKLMLDVLSDNYWTGYGIAGDRLFSNTIIINNNGIAYSHNFFIEILFSYGVLLGAIIILSTIYYVIHSIFFKSYMDTQVLLLILMVSVFIKLFISSSYLVEPLFPLFMGIVVAVYRA